MTEVVKVNPHKPPIPKAITFIDVPLGGRVFLGETPGGFVLTNTLTNERVPLGGGTLEVEVDEDGVDAFVFGFDPGGAEVFSDVAEKIRYKMPRILTFTS